MFFIISSLSPSEFLPRLVLDLWMQEQFQDSSDQRSYFYRITYVVPPFRHQTSAPYSQKYPQDTSPHPSMFPYGHGSYCFPVLHTISHFSSLRQCIFKSVASSMCVRRCRKARIYIFVYFYDFPLEKWKDFPTFFDRSFEKKKKLNRICAKFRSVLFFSVVNFRTPWIGFKYFSACF